MYKTKRAYEKPEKDDGFRVLVERLWPRGVTKEKAALDLWLKDIAPSPELREWFGHDPEKWGEFQKRYRQELKEKRDAVRLLRQKGERGAVTLVYGARDKQHNAAVALKGVLEGSRGREAGNRSRAEGSRRHNERTPECVSGAPLRSN